MSTLPGRPNLDQLRHQARDLHRAATGGDADSVRRVREVSASLTLSAAQLAIARQYGFASWAKLRAEVTSRRAAGPRDPSAAPERAAAGAGAGQPAAEILFADEELIDKQYADRPGLRPILDAVLAALPALGPVTVQARGTYVSLVSPRRTFAVVQAPTKSRVDLGLRLAEMTSDGHPAEPAPGGLRDVTPGGRREATPGGRREVTPGGRLREVTPGGRLRAAKNLGQANARIPLTSPDEVDDEVLGWLRHAYEQNTAPPPPRRPARRQAARLGPLTVVIEGTELPGRSFADRPDRPAYDNVHVALYTKAKDMPTLAMPGNPWQATQPVPGDVPAVRWQLTVTVRRGDDGYDFSGPFVRGVRDDRHLGLAWGVPLSDGAFWLFRGAKLRLVDVPDGVIKAAMRPGHHLTARVRLTDDRGGPVCARLRPTHLTWSAVPDGPGTPGA